MPAIAELLARELDKPLRHVENVIALLDEGQHHPLHRPLPQGTPRRDGRHRPAEAGGSPALPA